jgi:cation diffusion facilitator family transporter
MKTEQGKRNGRKALRSTITGILVSALLVIVKGAGGILGNSYALVADAVESLTDILSSTMLWLGLRWAAKPADSNHPYGHGKGEALVSLGTGIFLVAAAILIAVKSIQNIIVPHKTPEPYTLLILIVVIVSKEILYRFVLKTSKDVKSNAVAADAVHHRSDAITSAAAFVGISIGVIGGPQYAVADDYAALLASAIIVFNAYRIIRPAIGELLDEEMDPALNTSVKAVASAVERVEFVEKCMIRKMGVYLIADLHVWVDKTLSVKEGHHISHEVKAAIQREYPQFAEVMIHIEPAH